MTGFWLPVSAKLGIGQRLRNATNRVQHHGSVQRTTDKRANEGILVQMLSNPDFVIRGISNGNGSPLSKFKLQSLVIQ
jgi:hypothetical protein